MMPVDGAAAPKPETAILELAALLHSHGIGRLTIRPGGSPQVWHRFLRLLGRDPQAVREQGGFARSWAAAGGDHVELREIDYAEALREHTGSGAASWDGIASRISCSTHRCTALSLAFGVSMTRGGAPRDGSRPSRYRASSGARASPGSPRGNLMYLGIASRAPDCCSAQLRARTTGVVGPGRRAL